MRATELNLRKNKYFQLLTVVLVALIFITGKDLLHAFVIKHAFYLSESLLFGSYWLLFIPVLFYGKIAFLKAKFKFQLALPIVLGLLHVLTFAGLVTVISSLFYAFPFRFIPVFVKTISGYGFSSIAIYVVALYILRYQITAKEKIKPVETGILKIKQQNNTLLIRVEEVIFLKSETPYVGIHTSTGTYLMQNSLKKLMVELPTSLFIRVHKSSVINKAYIRSVNSRKNGDFDIVLKDSQTIRASRTYRKNFESLLH